MKRISTRSIFVLTSIMLGACNRTPSDAGDVTAVEYPESRGTLLTNTDLSSNGSVSWVTSAEVFYTSYAATTGTSHIRAVAVAGGAPRTIDGPRTGIVQSSFLTATPDGAHIFFAAGATASLYHKPPTAAAIQLTPSSVYATRAGSSAFGTPLVLSADSRFAAYIVAIDSVRAYDVAAQTSRPIAKGCATLIAYSPDGSELLCQLSQVLYVITVATGQRRELVQPASGKGRNLESVRWSSSGMKFVYSDALLRTDVVDASTGISTNMLAAGELRELEYPNYPAMTWSRNGQKVAIPTSLCLNTECTRVQITVHVLDMNTQKLQRAAVVNLTNSTSTAVSIGHMAFSPDGGLLAYLAGTTTQAGLYLVAVP